MPELLDANGLWDVIDANYLPGKQLFRMEQLPVYNVPHQSADLDAWLSGGQPNWEAKKEWWDVLAADRAAQKRQFRVRIFSEKLTDDELMACHWGYPYTVRAGEEIRVLRRGEHELPSGLLNVDYWLIADAHVLLMHYSSDGGFVGAELLNADRVEAFRRDQRVAWAAAEPFTQWWSRHDELHDPRRLAV